MINILGPDYRKSIKNGRDHEKYVMAFQQGYKTSAQHAKPDTRRKPNQGKGGYSRSYVEDIVGTI